MSLKIEKPESLEAIAKYMNKAVKQDGRPPCNNRDYHWKLVDRPDLHPEPMSLEEFIKLNEAQEPFAGWKVVEAPKVNKNMLCETYMINGEVYKVIKDFGSAEGYFITTPEGTTYHKRSNISAPFYNTIDILSGLVKSQYDSTTEGRRYEWCYKDVVNELGVGHSVPHIPRRYKKFTEEKSHELNYRATYLK